MYEFDEIGIWRLRLEVLWKKFPHDTVHEAGDGLQTAVRSDPSTFALWESLTPLGRDEFICWIDDAKQQPTRQRWIE